MELYSGDDLISLKESIQSSCSPTTESPPSILDPSADEYARYSGLTIDSHLLFDWPKLVSHDPCIASTFDDLPLGQLIEKAQLQECLFRAIIPAPEQWQMPVAPLQLLHQVCIACKEQDLRDLASQQCFSENLRYRALKLDVPALRSDHAIDCGRLARRVKTFLKEPLPNHRLPLHPSDIEKGEGLKFPQSTREKGRAQMSAVENEHLEVNRDTLVYLMQILKSEWTEEDQRGLYAGVSGYVKVGATEHLTPPLSPLVQSQPKYFAPDEEACELPEPSNPSSCLSADIEDAENRIFESDLEFWADILEADVSAGRFDDVDISEMIRAGDFRSNEIHSFPEPIPRDMELDVPLLPCSDNNDEDPRAAPRILASDDLVEAKALVLSSDTLSGSDGPTGQLVSFFQQRATTVMRSAEQEKLQPLDAIARVLVPVMDFFIPIPEWEERLWEPRMMFQRLREDTQVDWQGPKWPNNRLSEQRMLWSPLAHMGEKNLVLEHPGIISESLDLFLKRSRNGEVLTSADYVYKPPGLAILRPGHNEYEDDDYITPFEIPRELSLHLEEAWGIVDSLSLPSSNCTSQRSSRFSIVTPTPPPPDLATLLNRRKRLIDETVMERQPGRLNSEPGNVSVDILDPTLIPSTNVLRGFMNEYTDFAPLVDNFVEMNFPKRPKLTHRAFFDAPSTTSSTTTASKASDAARLMPPPPKPIPAIAPPIILPSIPPRIVVSSALSKPLTNHLETLIPGIELISRNYDKLQQQHHRHNEADIVVSPATGILLTTMVQLRQKPMPGGVGDYQKMPSGANPLNAGNTTAPFSLTTAAVASRHERLIVLVSEGNKHSETASPLSQSDARALAEFQGFAAGLQLRQQTEMWVVYVGGGAETLARWVAALVCDEYNYHMKGEAAGVRDLLLPVETYWEVFLRRAGMNAFAAQVVLGKLKVPDGQVAVGGARGEVYGLPLFVMMPRERRIVLFEEVLGGRKVLDRVSEVMDEPWGQRAVDEGGLEGGIGMTGWEF